MPRLATFLAATLLVAAASPTTAQEANPEPGYCAQFYPNADCNTGPDAPNGTAAKRSAKPPAAVKRKPRQQADTSKRK